MFTIRNAGGVALLLFGSTFLWLTPEFATPGVDTTGAGWAATRVLALVTVAGFTIATWGLFRRHSWWENAALASAGAGVLVLIPYWVAARGAGEVGPASTSSSISSVTSASSSSCSFPGCTSGSVGT